MPLASNQLSLTQGSALDSPWITCYDGLDTFSIYDNAAGTPNGVVTAERGSICTDLSTGTLYMKTINGTNLGWVALAVAGSGITTINGDTGSITGATVTIFANNATQNAGSTVLFENSGTTSTLNVSDSNNNTIIGKGSGNGTFTGTHNTFTGALIGPSAVTISNNTATGYFALNAINGTGGAANLNSAVGALALSKLTSGTFNCGLGTSAGVNLLTGSYNIAIGANSSGGASGVQWTSTESGNIAIGSAGVTGESNVTRIGTQALQTAAYMAGINGATPTSANTPQVTLCDNTGNLTTISSGTAGFVLTSNAGATPSFQAAPTGTYYSLTPYIVGSDIHSQFATISAAITQAVSDGATKTNQKNIYVKPGTYTEDLTMADGINVLAIDQPPQNVQFPSNQQLSVKLIGRIILSAASADCKVENLIVAPTNGLNCVEMSGTGVAVIKGCIFSITGTASLFNFTAGSQDLVIDNCTYGTVGTQAMFTIPTGVGGTVVMTDTDLFSNATSVVGGAGSGGLTLLANGCNLTLNIDASGASALNIAANYTNFYTGANNMFTDAAGTFTTISALYCSFNAVVNPFNIKCTTGGSGTFLFGCTGLPNLVNAGTTNKPFIVSGYAAPSAQTSMGIVSSPVASSVATAAFVTTLTLGTAVQNTTGYNLLVNISVWITAEAGSGPLKLGVGPTSTPTVNNVTATISAAGTWSFTALVPSNYWLLVSTTGSFTIGGITVQSCGV